MKEARIRLGDGTDDRVAADVARQAPSPPSVP